MDRNRLVKPIMLLMILLFVVDFIAQKLYWYYTIWWFDMPTHFFAGFWEGLLFMWFFSMEDSSFFRIHFKSIDLKVALKAILFVFVIGVLWEFSEILTHNYIGSDPFNLLDTLSDIFFDIAGGTAAIFYILFSQRKILKTKENELQLP